MIIIKIAGGLGDQMSRYALGRYLSIKNQTELFLDPSFYQSKHNYAECDTRFFGLDNYQITAKIAATSQIKKLVTNRYLKRLGFIKPTHIIGGVGDFNLEDFQFNGDCYVEGHCGIDRRWSDIRPILLKDFSLKESLELDEELAKWLSGSVVVALHCRRGDKANSPKVNQVHGTCSADYYQRAIEYMKKYLGDFNLLVFSD